MSSFKTSLKTLIHKAASAVAVRSTPHSLPMVAPHEDLNPLDKENVIDCNSSRDFSSGAKNIYHSLSSLSTSCYKPVKNLWEFLPNESCTVPVGGSREILIALQQSQPSVGVAAQKKWEPAADQGIDESEESYVDGSSTLKLSVEEEEKPPTQDSCSSSTSVENREENRLPPAPPTSMPTSMPIKQTPKPAASPPSTRFQKPTRSEQASAQKLVGTPTPTTQGNKRMTEQRAGRYQTPLVPALGTRVQTPVCQAKTTQDGFKRTKCSESTQLTSTPGDQAPPSATVTQGNPANVTRCASVSDSSRLNTEYSLTDNNRTSTESDEENSAAAMMAGARDAQATRCEKTLSYTSKFHVIRPAQDQAGMKRKFMTMRDLLSYVAIKSQKYEPESSVRLEDFPRSSLEAEAAFDVGSILYVDCGASTSADTLRNAATPLLGYLNTNSDSKTIRRQEDLTRIDSRIWDVYIGIAKKSDEAMKLTSSAYWKNDIHGGAEKFEESWGFWEQSVTIPFDDSPNCGETWVANYRILFATSAVKKGDKLTIPNDRKRNVKFVEEMCDEFIRDNRKASSEVAVSPVPSDPDVPCDENYFRTKVAEVSLKVRDCFKANEKNYSVWIKNGGISSCSKGMLELFAENWIECDKIEQKMTGMNFKSSKVSHDMEKTRQEILRYISPFATKYLKDMSPKKQIEVPDIIRILFAATQTVRV